MNKKGFIFITMGVLLLIIAVLAVILIFNDTIRDTVSIITNFLSASMLYILIIIGLIIAYYIGLLTWLFVLFKSLVGRIF
jgi:hypothetical protein